MRPDYRQTEAGKRRFSHPWIYRCTHLFKIALWKIGIPWHNTYSDECTPDFNCCVELSTEPKTSEWKDSKGHWTFRHDITGAFAMWACRQSPYGVPDGLESVCKYLDENLKTHFAWDANGMFELSLDRIKKSLEDILLVNSEFLAWNRCKVGETPEYVFTSSHEGDRDPDYDIIDLDALFQNVCLTIRDERRKDE